MSAIVRDVGKTKEEIARRLHLPLPPKPLERKARSSLVALGIGSKDARPLDDILERR